MNEIPDVTPKDNPNIKGYDEHGFPIYTDEYMKQQMKKPVDYADIYNSIVIIKEKELKDKTFDAMLEGTINFTKEEKLFQKDIIIYIPEKTVNYQNSSFIIQVSDLHSLFIFSFSISTVRYEQ